MLERGHEVMGRPLSLLELDQEEARLKPLLGLGRLCEGLFTPLPGMHLIVLVKGEECFIVGRPSCDRARGPLLANGLKQRSRQPFLSLIQVGDHQGQPRIIRHPRIRIGGQPLKGVDRAIQGPELQMDTADLILRVGRRRVRRVDADRLLIPLPSRVEVPQEHLDIPQSVQRRLTNRGLLALGGKLKDRPGLRGVALSQRNRA